MVGPLGILEGPQSAMVSPGRNPEMAGARSGTLANPCVLHLPLLLMMMLMTLTWTAGRHPGPWSPAMNRFRGALEYMRPQPRSATPPHEERPPLSLQLAQSVSEGARLALTHCQQLFRWRPWNCPAADFSLRAQRRVTREAALVCALTAAGVAHGVTRNCSRGDLPGCGCDDRLPQGLFHRTGSGDEEHDERQLPGGESQPEEFSWQWGGCSEAVRYGQAVARRFLDRGDQALDAVSFARTHNHHVGIQVVREFMEMRCKCHGTSGSCSMQTCWRQLRPFQKVAARLEQLYYDAIRVNYDEQLGSIALGNSVTMDHPDVPPDQLVYIEQSPNYCLPNTTSGWKGVRGRSCPKEVLDSGEVKDHCRDLCGSCGFAVSRDATIQTIPCNCDFQWCCRISCETCTSNVKYHHCK